MRNIMSASLSIAMQSSPTRCVARCSTTGAQGAAWLSVPRPQVPSSAVTCTQAPPHLGSHRLRWRLTLG